MSLLVWLRWPTNTESWSSRPCMKPRRWVFPATVFLTWSWHLTPASRRNKFGDRSLDLDLLLYDDLVLDEPGLLLPRPEIVEYAFVLKPLAEIAGEKRHPVTGLRFADIWDRFDASSQPMWPVEN